MKSSNLQLNVGLFSIGLDTYWPQFPGLRERLAAYTERVAQKLHACQVQVTNLGLIDTPEKSLAAGHDLRKADVDLIFLYVTTYALSSTVLPAVRRAKAPVINFESRALIGHRLREFQSSWRSRQDDRGVVGVLSGLSSPRNRQRL